MGTKANPGPYDCYARAEDDEPLFILRAKDPVAEYLVAAWVSLRAGDTATAVQMVLDAAKEWEGCGKEKLPYTSEKSVEAQQCSRDMRLWRQRKRPEEIERKLAAQAKPDGEKGRRMATALEIAREYFPTANDQELDALIWEETGFPYFWNIPQDGNTPEECLRTQLRKAKKNLPRRKPRKGKP